MPSIEELSQIKEYLEQLVPDLEANAWNKFADCTSIKQIPKGDNFIIPGKTCEYVSFINKGLIRSYYLVDGKEMITAFFGEGDYFSDYESFLSRKPTVMYSQAIEETIVVDINYTNLQTLYTEFPQCERIGRLIAEDLFMHLSSRTSAFLMQTPEQRYLNFLEEYEPIIQRVPQYMIAAYLGITPEALSRIRARMSRKSIDANQ